MPYTQDNRSIAIATPLGKDKLLLRALTINEQLGRPFVMRADLLSEEPAVDFLRIIGKGVTIRWRMPEASGGEAKRYFSGYVSSFVQRPRADGFYRYEATIVPWLWFLTRTADCRIFHSAMTDPPEDMTVPGIIKKVFKDHAFDDVTPALTGSYRTLDHCVQYRETDFNFVSRLMEQEGIYYFFEHVDEGGTIKHKLKLADAKSAHSEYPGYETIKFRATTGDAAEAKGTILDWARVKQVQSGTYKVNDFDFKRPKTSLLGSSTQEDSHSNDGFEIYDFSANYADEDSGDHGDAYAKLRIEELKAQHDIVMGRSDCPGLSCGSKFKLEGHPRDDENDEYLVVAINYRCTAETYKQSGGGQNDVKVFQCDFTAIPADHTFRPARVTQKPRIQGPQTAIVVGKAGEEILTDEFGRIKVQFHWDRYSPANENTPCWVRVSQAWAGKNWGSVFLPRIGQEVIVEFLDGNPDRPIVTGAVYNGESKPPYALPDKATVSTIKSNSSKGGQGFNEFRFEDKKGSEQIFLHAEKDQDIRVKEVTKEWIGKDRHLIVKENQRELIEKDKHTHVKGDQLLKVEGNYGRTIAKNEVAKISGNDHLSVQGDYVQKIGGNLHQKITGNHHEKATGDIHLTATGNADMKASQNAAVVGDMNTHIKGGMVVVVEAGMQLSLKAGANFIDIGPAGISIQGTMVNINMGGAAGSGSGAQAASPSDPNDPDSITDPAEADKAEAGSSDRKTAPSPPTPKRFSPSAIALQEAAAGASPMVDSPSDSDSAAADAAANANAASAAATAGANAATTAGASATAAAASANAAVASASINISGNVSLTTACNAASAAAAAATTAAANANAAAATANAAAANATTAAANVSGSSSVSVAVSASANGDAGSADDDSSDGEAQNGNGSPDSIASANDAASTAYTAAANANTAAANATVAAANANTATANVNVAAAAGAPAAAST